MTIGNKITRIFVVHQSLIFLFLTQNQTHGNASTSRYIDNVNSTCFNLGTTKWNRNNVEENLKLWIKSIHEVPVTQIGKNIQFEHRKVVKRHPRTNILTFIASIEGSTNKYVGPVWKIAGLASRRQFHNGFLYGKLNEEELLTGIYL